MKLTPHRPFRLVFAVLLSVRLTLPLLAQPSNAGPVIPEKFTWDMETAARLRPVLLVNTMAASGRYALGQQVLHRLLIQARSPASLKWTWELCIVNDDQLNAFSSPDGTTFVDRDLAALAGANPGLWAAMLSHEIAHVLHRDWGATLPLS